MTPLQTLARALKETPNRADRFAMVKGEWDEVIWDHQAFRRYENPEASNTITSILTNFLVDGSITDLQNRWAPLQAFTFTFDPSAVSPLSPAIIKHVTAGATAQTNPTNYESGDSTVAPVTATPNEYSVSFQISNTDLNSGVQMANLVTVNTANFADKVLNIAMGPVTIANFNGSTAFGGAASLICAASAFGLNELQILQGALSKSPIKNLILDPNYIARIANQPGFYQKAGTVGGPSNGWVAYGWDGIFQNTNFTGAGPNVKGFACKPGAIGGVWGPPLLPPMIPGGILQNQIQTVPGLEAKVLAEYWFNPATRTSWASLRTILGVNKVDGTAGYIVTSQ